MQYIVNIWWEDASIHYLVTRLGAGYYRKQETEYWCSGQSYGGENGDTVWSSGKPSPEFAAVADFACSYYCRQQDRAKSSWTEYHETKYQELLAAVGAKGSRYGPIISLSVQSSSTPFQGWINPGYLLEHEEEED